MHWGPGNRCEKILIIQMCRMGDVVQSLPLLKRLKQTKPTCETTLLCIRESIELLNGCPLVDRFVAVPYAYYKTLHAIRSPSPRLGFILSLPELCESYDLVVNLTHGYFSALICQAVASRKKSGRFYLGEDRVGVAGDWGKYLFCAVSSRANRMENLINLVDIHVGMAGLAHGAMDRWLDVKEGEAARAEEILKSSGWKQTGKLAALQLGANELHRAWPVGNFAALGSYLAGRLGAEVVLLGSPGEKRLGEDFLGQTSAEIVNLIGKTRVADLPSILQRCDLLISNDTGTSHIAAAVGTRVLGLYFSTAYFAETGPFGSGHLVLQVQTECSPCQNQRCEQTWCRDYLDVEAVKTAAERMLYGKKGALPDYPNLGAYESRFLSNGTMIYAPITSRVPEGYETAFINGMFWQRALGLVPDKEFEDEMLEKLAPSPSFRAKVEALGRRYALLARLYRDGLKVLSDAARFDQRPPTQCDTVLEALAGINAHIFSAAESTIMGTFHDYEIMDMDWTNDVEAGRKLIEKYAKLRRMAEGFSGLFSQWHCLDGGPRG
ncbi:MAG: glycosyltransferase family 9 protein [Syntrophobacteraceae bacterium]